METIPVDIAKENEDWGNLSVKLANVLSMDYVVLLFLLVEKVTGNCLIQNINVNPWRKRLPQ